MAYFFLALAERENFTGVRLVREEADEGDPLCSGNRFL
jgi:hypothetical protein